MFIHFKHINKMLQFGPYGPNHATAATFAFKRELLSKTKFDESSSVAEERKFLKDYTIPFVQLDSNKTILVFSHDHNSFDKKELLKQMPNPCIHETPLTPNDIIKESDILKFFMEDIDSLLEQYHPGRPEHKPDVQKQLLELKTKRELQFQEQKQKQVEYQNTMSKINTILQPQNVQQQIQEQAMLIQQITLENNQLKEQVEYLNAKIKQLIMAQIEKKKHDALPSIEYNI
jgi:hypothetical protein